MYQSSPPEESSVPKKLFSWLCSLHPQQRIVVDGLSFPGFGLFDYLHKEDIIPSDDLSFVPNKVGLGELVWHDCAQPPERSENAVDSWERKTLMGDMGDGVVMEQLVNGSVDFTYEGTPMRAYHFDYVRGFDGREAIFLVWQGESDSKGPKLIERVYRWRNVLNKEVFMFDERWKKSKDLYKSMQLARPEEIVLSDSILESLSRYVDTFFSSQSIYQDLDVAWKGGILLIGPPGNGKRETIKAILKRHNYRPVLYAKSFQTGRFSTPERGIRAIFDKARTCSQCILVIEDLDSLVCTETKSFLLNEIYGLEANDGIIIIATSNHPDKLDNAFTKRPSRFETKYHLDNPTHSQRREFITTWLNGKLKKYNIDIGDDNSVQYVDIGEKLVNGTDGSSFAFLKEMFVSFSLLMVADKTTTSGKSPIALLMYILEQLGDHLKGASRW